MESARLQQIQSNSNFNGASPGKKMKHDDNREIVEVVSCWSVGMEVNLAMDPAIKIKCAQIAFAATSIALSFECHGTQCLASCKALMYSPAAVSSPQGFLAGPAG